MHPLTKKANIKIQILRRLSEQKVLVSDSLVSATVTDIVNEWDYSYDYLFYMCASNTFLVQ